ncbi:hypothetical protein D3C81_1542090 [compost metagenome]
MWLGRQGRPSAIRSRECGVSLALRPYLQGGLGSPYPLAVVLDRIFRPVSGVLGDVGKQPVGMLMVVVAWLRQHAAVVLPDEVTQLLEEEGPSRRCNRLLATTGRGTSREIWTRSRAAGGLHTASIS